jgi:hypothetical protein
MPVSVPAKKAIEYESNGFGFGVQTLKNNLDSDFTD